MLHVIVRGSDSAIELVSQISESAHARQELRNVLKYQENL